MTDAELIKSKIDIVEFIGNYVTLKKAGRNFKALCPFHSEKTPSFIVSPERQTWHCFGSCAQGGDVIKFYEKWENIDFLEALKDLASKSGVVLQQFTPTIESALKEKLYEVNHLAGEFYHYLLTKHKLGQRVLNYLKDRKIKDETIKNFLLGYAPNSWDALAKFLDKKGYQTDLLEKGGLLIKGNSGRYYDRFRGRLMFALKNTRGQVNGFSGRVIPPQAEKEAKYINSPETPIYIKGDILYGFDQSKESIKKTNEAIIVEGEFDFLLSFQAGMTNAVAIKGSALTENQTMLLKRYTENVILALDADFAGNEAAKRGIEIAENANLNVKVVNLPEGKDPADCINEGAHLWKNALKAAVPIYDFIISQAFKKFDKSEVSGKRKISEEIIPFLAKIQNPIINSHYLKFLAKELNVTEESIESAVSQFQKKGTFAKAVKDKEQSPKKRNILLEEHCLALIVQSENAKDSLIKVLEICVMDDFDLNPVKNILEILKKFFVKNTKFEVKKLNKLISPEISPAFDRAYLSELGSFLFDKDLFEKELTKTAKEIKKQSVRRNINALTTKIRQSQFEENSRDFQKTNMEIKNYLQTLRELEN